MICPHYNGYRIPQKPTMFKLERQSKLLVMLRHFRNQLIHEMAFLVKSPAWVTLHHISDQTINNVHNIPSSSFLTSISHIH